MVSTTPPSSNHIAWIHIKDLKGSQLAKIGGPYFDTGRTEDYEPIMNILVGNNFSKDGMKIIPDFIFPEAQRNEIPNDEPIIDESHKVVIKFEDNQIVAEAYRNAVAGNKPIDVWMVFRPKIDLGEEIRMDAANAADLVNVLIVPGRSRFNVGSPGTPISTFITRDEAVSHAEGVLEKNIGDGCGTEGCLDKDIELSYGAVVTEDRSVRHLVAILKVHVVVNK